MSKKEKKADPEWVRNMRRLMDERGFNPRSLSLRAGLNATAVRDMIEGRSRSPRYDTIQAMADALGTTPAILMCDEKTAANIQGKGDAFGRDIELLTEIISRLVEVAEEKKRELSPRELAAMSATLYRRMQESGDTTAKNRAAFKTQIHDLFEYEALRHKRGRQ